MSSTPLKGSNGSLFIQTTPGKTAQYIGCLDLDPLVEPAGDQTLIHCRNRDGVLETIGVSQGIPAAVTTGLKGPVFPEGDILDTLTRCDFALYALLRDCGRAGLFSNFVRAEIVQHARITSRQVENAVMRESDDMTLRTLAISGYNPIFRPRNVSVVREAIAETGNLDAVTFYDTLQCASNCGAFQLPGLRGAVAGVAAAGSPTTLSDVWWTLTGGGLWTPGTGGAAHPFGGGVDVMALGGFYLDATTIRMIAVRKQVNAEPLKIAYSDDLGATWTLVTLGATNNEGCANAKALYIADRDHLWLATTAGNIYFSSNAGASWTAQSSALSASGGSSLKAISFSDYSNGWAGGAASALIKTTDGGATWAAVTPPVAMNITSLHAFSKLRVIIGSDSGKLYETWDGFVSDFEAKTFSGQTASSTIKALTFVNDHVGFMITNTASPVGTIHRSIDGGDQWELLVTPSNLGLNDIFQVNENLAYAVGNVQGGTSVVLKVSA